MYKFGSENITTGSIHWHCIKYNCAAKIYTTNRIVTNARDSIQHNHEPLNEKEIIDKL